MIKALPLIALFFFMLTGDLHSVESKTASGARGNKNFGLGLSLFSPTGITGKYWLDDKKSLEGTLGLGFEKNWGGYIHAVFLYNLKELKPNTWLYVGGGIAFSQRTQKVKPEQGRFVETEDSFVSTGIRVPVGISYRNIEKNFEIFGELGLNIYLGYRSGLVPGISIGARYYF